MINVSRTGVSRSRVSANQSTLLFGQTPYHHSPILKSEYRMSPIVMILVIILILSIFGGGYGYRRGNNVLAGGGGIVGLLLLVLIILFLMGRI